MTNKLHLVQQVGRLTCYWVATADPKMPLTCIWTRLSAEQAASTASSADKTGRVHLCA
jgi:hypothetical protein